MDPFQNRRWVLILIILSISLIFIFRLLYIQVINKEWAQRAAQISSKTENIQPPRGFIYDRNGLLLVGAEKVYDIYILPNAIVKSDSLKICNLFDITIENLRTLIKKASTGYNVPYKASVLFESLSKQEHAWISPYLGQIKSVYAKAKTDRGYPKEVAPHLLGYIRRISQNQYELAKDSGDNFYSKNDFLGITGLEKIYEKHLRGERGNINYLKDYAGNKVETINKKPAKPGKDIHTSIDIELQKLGEDLMQNKIGSIVAIEPSSGEILCMVSAPFYKPSLLTGKDFAKEYKSLKQNDSLKPLINRPIYNDRYRPGSIFKLVQALIALQNGVIDSNSSFICDKRIIGCHNHEPPDNLIKAIKHSCNPYFYQVYKKIILSKSFVNYFEESRKGLKSWEENVKTFGFGAPLGTDIPEEKSGFIPDVKFYDSWYGEKRWAYSTIYSNSIGEGEIGVSPIQMANLAAIIANRGYYYTPHFIKSINTEKPSEKYTTKKLTCVEKKHFQPVVSAMNEVVNYGTGRNAQIDSIEVCGKTGTVENKTFNDHSVFIAFAPKEKPKIAIAVYVEYGTWGSKWAAPISSVMMEYYLKRRNSIKNELKKEMIKEAIILNPLSDFTN
mgnify:CR=1 FL=1